MKLIDLYNEAFLTKDIYDKKREYAASRMEKNKEIEALTEDQHDALSNLCAKRHELHSNMDSAVKSDDNKIRTDLILANIQILDSGLPPMNFIPIDESDYIDIDTISLLYEIDEVPDDPNDKQKWYDENYNRIYNELSNLNDNIEKYLKQFDEKYGTDYCPTGFSRRF